MVADFSKTLGKDSKITLSPNGNIVINLEQTEMLRRACESPRIGIFEPGVVALDESTTNCPVVVGRQYDPTHHCLANSASDHCRQGVRCKDREGKAAAKWQYNCDFGKGRYSCAPGDISGKFGSITNGKAKFSGHLSLIPPTDSLIGKVMVIHCAEPGMSAVDRNAAYVVCAPIKEAFEEEERAKLAILSALVGVFVLSIIMCIR